jgi:hypothetical protein
VRVLFGCSKRGRPSPGRWPPLGAPARGHPLPCAGEGRYRAASRSSRTKLAPMPAGRGATRRSCSIVGFRSWSVGKPAADDRCQATQPRHGRRRGTPPHRRRLEAGAPGGPSAAGTAGGGSGDGLGQSGGARSSVSGPARSASGNGGMLPRVGSRSSVTREGLQDFAPKDEEVARSRGQKEEHQILVHVAYSCTRTFRNPFIP